MLAANSHDRVTDDWIVHTRRRIETSLEHLLDGGSESPVREAMRYSVLAPGKRMRPLLTLAVTEFLGGNPKQAMRTACAIEMIHCASLILDDLPCMDNDSERRSRVATHVQFGEGLTILAAVSLLTQSCCTVASDDALPSDLRLKVVQLLCDTVGPHGLSLGQCIDLRAKDNSAGAAAMTDLHHLKTGVLFLAAARSACLIAGATPSQMDKVLEYSSCIGLAYQLQDDLKDVGEHGPNMVTHIGVAGAERQLVDYLQAAYVAISGERNTSVLQEFARAFIKAGRFHAAGHQSGYRENRF